MRDKDNESERGKGGNEGETEGERQKASMRENITRKNYRGRKER